MATDTAALRAELKAFERDFKQQNGRAPGVDDIKNAGFADRYKLYKKLSKPDKSTSSGSVLPPSSLKPTDRPSTPPRSVPRKTEAPSSIVPKSRAVRTEISSSNPFSPRKDKGKQKQVAPLHDARQDKLPNPFATPSKAKSVQRSSARPLSPDPFPLIDATQDTRAPPQREPGPSNPISRARKRLRGEPVSPSPIKEKRARISSGAILPFPNLSTLATEDSDNEVDAEQANLSFVADSPIKAQPKGSAFKILFDDDVSAMTSANALLKNGLARSKAVQVTNGPFGTSSQRARSMSGSSDDLAEKDNHQKPFDMKYADRPQRKGDAKKTVVKKAGRRSHMNGFAFTKNNLFESIESTASAADASQSSVQLAGRLDGTSHSRTSVKRSLDDGDPEKSSSVQPADRLPLLPPSPPPAGSKPSYNNKGKGKATGRKKPKITDGADEDDDDDSPDDANVKVREWSWQRREQDSANTADIDFDPVLGLGAHDRQQNPTTPGPTSDDEPGEFEVNLPEDLRRMLAISPSKAHDAGEVGVVRGLLYGVRTAHYDALKGGDIWDAGETGDGTEGEDDWEGEPVPWETGEL
ncbi:hypothetical protein BV25DRAFT_1912550 [Artomyces pyxidatus]|uniref:Uncharacterized protein n=1 Tax=Artomyces pyxidatus TaxID=48021 RepID=A0ACB8TDH3_9AGAM|nr:hypothetical protein BV25DRAFT_1912550 [Artomyces pyxidatus]